LTDTTKSVVSREEDKARDGKPQHFFLQISLSGLEHIKSGFGVYTEK